MAAGSGWPVPLKKAGQLRHHHGHEDDDQADAGDDEHRGINERLCHAIAQRLDVGEMRDEALEDFRQRAARLAGGDEIDVERGKDARVIAHRLREAAAIDERLVQALRKALQLGMLHPPHEDAERLVERHARARGDARVVR